MDLNPLREEINRIDSDLVSLLDRRAEIARLVGQSKAQAGATTFDGGRAKAVVHQALSRSNGQFPKEGMVYVFREILSACLNLQKSLRIGFMGPRDTYSHLAAIREFGSSVEFIPFKLIRDVFTAVENGEVDYGIVPIENSNGGTVHLTLDAFIEHPCRVCSEVLLPIHLSILGNCEVSAIRKIYSHPQPFLQCDRWLKANLPNAARMEVDSTTQGMIEAKKDPFGAAIGNEFAADEYGLRVLAKNVEDSDENTTRFLVISKTDAHPSGDDKTSIMFSVADRPGALLRVLKPFDDLKINLSKLESRPTKRRAWEQAFFVDADGHRNDAVIQEALEEIRPHCESVVVLGSYPRDKSPREIQEMKDRS
ncbi:MAG: prephenate dehydratase [Candidatus Sumerlaeota bacterium]